MGLWATVIFFAIFIPYQSSKYFNNSATTLKKGEGPEKYKPTTK